jgi:hypothetical protein
MIKKDIVPGDGKRFAFAVSFQPTTGTNVEVTCYFLAPGFNGDKWFKQAVWEGPGGKSEGTHAASFLEQYGYSQEDTHKIRMGEYGTVWGRSNNGDWKAVTSATSSTANKVRSG